MIQFYSESGLESVESEISILNKNPNQIIVYYYSYQYYYS
jgi:hypothetical protein